MKRLLALALLSSQSLCLAAAPILNNANADQAERYFYYMCNMLGAQLKSHYTTCFRIHVHHEVKTQACQLAAHQEKQYEDICIKNQHLKRSAPMQALVGMHRFLYGDDNYGRLYSSHYGLTRQQFDLYRKYCDFITESFLMQPTEAKAKILSAPASIVAFIKHLFASNQAELARQVNTTADLDEWFKLHQHIHVNNATRQSYIQISRQLSQAKQAHATAKLQAQQAQQPPKKPLYDVGGKLDWDLVRKTRTNSFEGKRITRGYIGLAEVSGELNPTQWMSFITSLTYAQSAEVGTRGAKITLDQASMTLGNLYHQPWYLTLGKVYYPFGLYIPFSFFGTINQNMSGLHAPGAIVGYSKAPFYAAVFTYARNGEVNNKPSRDVPLLRNYGAEIGLTSLANKEQYGYHVNLSYVNNFNESTSIAGLRPVNLVKVGAGALHFAYHYHRVGFMTDYLTMLKPYNTSAFSLNNNAVHMWGWTNQVYVHLNVWHFPSVLSFGYGMSHDALAISEPKHLYMVTFSVHLNPHITLETLYSYAKDYSTSDVSRVSTVVGPAQVTRIGTGKNQSVIGLRLSVGLGRDQPDFPSPD